MKLHELFNEFMENDDFNETEIKTANKQLFNKINGEISKIEKPININIFDIALMDFDDVCIYEFLYNDFMDEIKTYINDILEIANKYKNENINVSRET